VFVLFYTTDAGFSSYASIELADVVVGVSGVGAHFGTSVAAMGDLDGDGVRLLLALAKSKYSYFLSLFDSSS
jgi:hypothetical protein